MHELGAVLETYRTNQKPDYKQVSAMYKKYWETCTSAYIFGTEEKKELSIEKLIDAPPSTMSVSRRTQSYGR
jgi:hypothetical protein